MKKTVIVIVVLLFSFLGANMLFAFCYSPASFTFTDRTNVALSTEYKSNAITVSGLGGAAPISITGAAYTSASGFVDNGYTVKVRKVSAATYSTTKSATLTICSVSDTFSVTTMANPVDTIPDAFHFTDRTNVALNTEYKSNAITVTGINTASPISITGGTYSINGGTYTSASSTVTVGNTVKVRKVSSSAYSTTKSATLTIGGVSDTFSVTTMAADTTPDAFHFTDQTGVALSTLTTSSAITVAGINTAADISIVGGTYAINGGGYTSASGTVNAGNTVTVQQTSSASYSTTTDAILTIGGVSDTFSVTTENRIMFFSSNWGDNSIKITDDINSLAGGATATPRIVTGSNVPLPNPTNDSLAVDRSREMVYVTDSTNHNIIVYHNAKTVTGNIAPDRTITINTAIQMSGIAIDSTNDRLYAAGHNGDHRCVFILNNASTLTGAKTADVVLTVSAEAVFIDQQNDRLYVGKNTADSGDGEVYVYDNASTMISTATPTRTITIVDSTPTTHINTYALRVDAGTDRLYFGSLNTSTGGYNFFIFNNASTLSGSIDPDTASAARMAFLTINVMVDNQDRLYMWGDSATSVNIYNNASKLSGVISTTPDKTIYGVVNKGYGMDYLSYKIYAIGDTGPSGVGKVFYISNGGLNGLEAAPALWYGGAADPNEPWITGIDYSVTPPNDTNGTRNGNTLKAIGTGLANSNAIMAQPGHTASAAKLCRDYRGGGKDDWFLPSNDELWQMYLQKAVIGDYYPSEAYWSSSEGDPWTGGGSAFCGYLGNGDWYGNWGKGWASRVRAVRAF